MFNLSTWGHFCIAAALGSAFLQGLMPAIGYWKKNIYLQALARPLALLQGFFVSNAFLLLIVAFISNDFSLAYVAHNSHPSLPFFYRLTAVWGAHEGSFLLWIFLLAWWTILFCRCHQTLHKEIFTLSLSLLGWINFSFLLFLDKTSHPFKINVHGLPQDLNPLLQDPGFFIHPPLLYAGYVGFSVVFALTIAYILQGNSATTTKASLVEAWANTIRPWVLAAWSFLTIGITLGSWWAYHVLGWGGFWFWDPVENASLLPWLSGAALLHVLIVVSKQQRFYDWAIILAILSFSLSILGTFLVRSGVLISVHSFASDPSRGLFLLLLLAVITGSALSIYLLRWVFPLGASLSSQAAQPWLWFSREGMLLLQSIVIFTALSTILLGTLYPLIIQALGLGALSVGPPYFNRVLFPVLLMILLAMGLAPFSQWQNHFVSRRPLYQNAALSLVLAILLSCFFSRHWSSFIICNLSLVFWVLLSIRQGFSRQVALSLAHGGFAIVIMSIVLSATFTQSKEIQLQIGEKVVLGPYKIYFIDIEGVPGANFKSIRGHFALQRNNTVITYLYPEKRIYTVRDTVMTKVAIYPALFHDVYLAMGEPLTENNWSLRIYYKPFIRWVWIGGLCIAIGGFWSLLQLMRRRHA